MRHDNLEHHRNRVEPFEVVGPAKFIASVLGWDHDHFVTTLEAHLVSGQGVEVLVGDKRKPAIIIAWDVSGCMDQDATFKVKLHPVRPVQAAPASPAPDPWVKVGTTTIDGTLEQVAGAMLNGGKPSTLRPDTIEEFIDGRVRSQDPIHVGGRWLRLMGSHINASRGTALIRCDVVRRQSEIDAETKRANLRPDPGVRDAYPALPCPECGPHGNRGEVLLASSWARCTTCNGGKAGDLWGEVKAEDAPPAKRHVLAIGGLVFDEEVEVKHGPRAALWSHDIDPRARRTMVYFASGRTETFDVPAGATRIMIDDNNETVEFEVPVASGPPSITAGFKVPALSEMHGAALDNLYRYLCGPPNGMSREEYRRILFGEQAP